MEPWILAYGLATYIAGIYVGNAVAKARRK